MINAYFSINSYWAIPTFLIGLILLFRYFKLKNTYLYKTNLITLLIALIGIIIGWSNFWQSWRDNRFESVVWFSLIHIYLYITSKSFFKNLLEKIDLDQKIFIKYAYLIAFYLSITRMIFFYNNFNRLVYSDQIALFIIPIIILNYIWRKGSFISWVISKSERRPTNKIELKQSKIDEKFSKLKSLLDSGYITKEDYEKKKKDLIDSI